ncbi:amidase [Orrella sp. 11846]|uniref:amidase n=1 Tax=Orrella sp. 11846 TaxID=3409913 RepID=UPI003B5B5C9B
MKQTIVSLSAVEQRQKIARKEISPVELVRAHIEQIESLNPGLNAICATDFERAIETARTAEQSVIMGKPLGLLHGLPIGVKDLTDTAGLLTTYGNTSYTQHIPKQDNSLITRLKLAGGIVLAKTNTPDMGAGANTRNEVWGATGNPFNTQLNAGGSSGGSAAALATDMVPLATGTDVGGSLRIPAALCGVVGMRPSPGFIGQDQRKLGWAVLNTIGPMARDVADTALFFAASMGADAADPLVFPADPATVWPQRRVELSALRVGYTEDFDCCQVDPMIRRVFMQRVRAIADHVHVCEPVTFDFPDAHETFDVLRAEGFLAQMGSVSENDLASLSPNVRANLELAQRMTLADRAKAHLSQTRLMRQFAQAFQKYDIILSPTTPVTPFPWTTWYADTIEGQAMQNYYQWLALTYVITLSTQPALSLPMGLDEAGMPFGMQIIAPLYKDGRLLAIAKEFEDAFAHQPNLSRPKTEFGKLTVRNDSLRSIVTHAPGTI